MKQHSILHLNKSSLEDKLIVNNPNKKYIFLFAIIAVLSFVIRFWGLGDIPGGGGLNQDEAYAGYNAYSLLHYGYDSEGYSNPVYFVAWGSGMNVLESYCMIPFIKTLGLTTFSIRLPMALLGVISVIVFGLLLKMYFGEDKSLIGMTLLAIIPWHVMLSRWGLESNFFPGMCLLGLFFLFKSIYNRKYIILGMLFYGLSLYAYASPWIVMPFLVMGSVLYLVVTQRKYGIYLWIGLGVLGLVAAPLLLFVLVNMQLINPIVAPYISIPKLVVFRSADMGSTIDAIKNNIIFLCSFLLKQDDKLIWNSIPQIGTLYKVSYPFLVIGIAVSFYKAIRDYKNNTLDVLINIQFTLSILLGILQEINANKINIILIPLVYYCFRGIVAVYELTGARSGKLAICGIATLYCISFIFFANVYFTDYREKMEKHWGSGVDKALEYAVSIDADETSVMDIEYPVVLFFTKYPTDVFIRTVKWIDEKDAIRPIKSIEGYSFEDFYESIPEQNKVYICKADNEEGVTFMEDNKMRIERFDNYVVGTMK